MSDTGQPLPGPGPRRRAPLPPPPPEQRDAERLAALARECRASGIPRRVLLLRLSSLPQHRVQPHQLRLMHEALVPLGVADRANFYRLPNEDLAVTWRGHAGAALQESLDTIHLLFTGNVAPAAEPNALAVVLDLPAQADTLLRSIAEALRPAAPLPPPLPPRRATKPLDQAAVAALEAALAQASVDRFARRRPVCALVAGRGFELRWEKRFLSVAEIFEALLPDRAPAADPWLFLRLTRALDRRMLMQLAAPAELREAGPFSLDLNVASILSAEFLRFDGELPATLRGKVVLNLRTEDMLADPAAFVFARDFARGRGYRLLLRGITAERLPLFPRHLSGLDLLQLRWSPALAAAELEALLPEHTTLLLSGVDTPEALAWGRGHRIRLFQGKLVAPGRSLPPA